MFLTFRCAVPASYSKTQRQDALRGLTPCKVGDADNLSKSVMDMLTTLKVWMDDKQVDQLTVRKCYGERDEIVIRIEAIEGVQSPTPQPQPA